VRNSPRPTDPLDHLGQPRPGHYHDVAFEDAHPGLANDPQFDKFSPTGANLVQVDAPFLDPGNDVENDIRVEGRQPLARQLGVTRDAARDRVDTAGNREHIVVESVGARGPHPSYDSATDIMADHHHRPRTGHAGHELRDRGQPFLDRGPQLSPPPGNAARRGEDRDRLQNPGDVVLVDTQNWDPQ